jgi:diketogulonate reductase-like aldo/keto reductase
MRTLTLAGTVDLPVLGLGTWMMGEEPGRRAAEVRAVRHAIELGYRLFDTAEMYGEGGAEEVLGQAIGEALRAGEVRRDELTIVSKVYPHNASRSGTQAACDRSRKRLGLDHIDVYLLHWPGHHPLADTVAGMRALRRARVIRAWGVSNFDVTDMLALAEASGPAGAGVGSGVDPDDCACNQVYYSPTVRGVEFDLLPWLQQHGQALMAYSPVDHGRLAQAVVIDRIARREGLSAARLALAWLLTRPGVCVIPKAVSQAHQRDNLAAVQLQLAPSLLGELEAAYPAPRRKTPLAML